MFVPAPPVERQAYTCREQFGSRSDKAVRAQSIRGRMAMLGLYVRQGALWLAALRAELLLAGGSSLAIIGAPPSPRDYAAVLTRGSPLTRAPSVRRG
jgi:hypothetical protein